MWWPLTLTYIFKVTRPWLRKSCPLCSVYNFGWILFIFGTNDHYYERVCRVLHFVKNLQIWIFGKFLKFCSLDLEKKIYTVLDGFFPYLAQMITSMRECVAYNDLWPWPISSRSFSLGLENRVRSVASTVPDGFFPYLVQMITGMRWCVACDDLWPWPISSRSFDLDFENRVRSVTFSVLDRLFPYLRQIITTIRGCVAWKVYNKILKFKFFTNFSASTMKNNLQFCLHSFHIWHKSSLASDGVSHVMTFDLYLQGHLTLFWLGIQHDSIVWVIMRRQGVSSERRRSSCSSSLRSLTIMDGYIMPILPFVALVLFYYECIKILSAIFYKQIYDKKSFGKSYYCLHV